MTRDRPNDPFRPSVGIAVHWVRLRLVCAQFSHHPVRPISPDSQFPAPAIGPGRRRGGSGRVGGKGYDPWYWHRLCCQRLKADLTRDPGDQGQPPPRPDLCGPLKSQPGPAALRDRRSTTLPATTHTRLKLPHPSP